jgi:hypothetical protein
MPPEPDSPFKTGLIKRSPIIGRRYENVLLLGFETNFYGN